MSETESHENPLIPNSKLRQIYTAMVEARLLDEHIAILQRKSKARHRLYSTHGQEACRVTTAIELGPGDLISDVETNATMDLIFGAKLAPLLRHVVAVVSGAKPRTTMPIEKSMTGHHLPWIEDSGDRLKIACGAALNLKILGQGNIVVAYVERAEMPRKEWKQVLSLAARLNLPIIFVVFSGSESKDTRGANVCAKARAAGIPGIPVSANDAVALYRVAQESTGRSRGGDGPVLIECIFAPTAGQRRDGTNDPILHMKDFLIDRKVCSEDWADGAGDEFRKKCRIKSLTA